MKTTFKYTQRLTISYIPQGYNSVKEGLSERRCFGELRAKDAI